MWVSRVHVHDICHEGECGELVGEGAAEKPEVGKIGECGAEVVLDHCGRDVFFLDGCKSLKPNAVCMIDIFLFVCQLLS